MPNSPTPLWAITSYFNPSQYHTKLQNFKTFHQSLGVPLVVAELIADDQKSELASYLSSNENPDHTIHLRIHASSTMWQKERLLNLALAKVPAAIDYIAWIDCDVLFHTPTWHEKMVEALHVNPMIQGFSRLIYLPSGINRVPLCHMGLPVLESFVASRSSSVKQYGAQGSVWAAKANLLRQHGLYDAMITGGGDTALTSAIIGDLAAMGSYRPIKGDTNRREYYSYLTKAHLSHYQTWAKSFQENLRSQGRVACLNETIYHLYHGARNHRQYVARHQALLDNCFDPNKDIALNKEGAWEWSSNKKELHNSLIRYFSERQEDNPGH
jgi:hypothetical protein